MEKVLAIYDFETDFSSNLMEYLNRRKGFSFRTRVFTTIESLKGYLSQNRIEILLLGEDAAELFEGELCGRQNIGQICILSESSHVREDSPYPVIFKFQSAEELLREILELYEENGRGTLSGTALLTGTKIYSVCSPCGGSGKTCLSLAAALVLAEYGETLYVCLEPYSVLQVILKKKPEQGISEWIYYLKENVAGLKAKFRSIVIREGAVDYLAGPSHGIDLNEFREEEMEKWLKQLSEEETYRYAVFDIGIMSEAVLSLLRHSSEIFVPVGEGYLEEEKYGCFLNQLTRSGDGNLADRLKRLKLPEAEELREKSFELWQLKDGRLGGFVQELLKNERTC